MAGTLEFGTLPAVNRVRAWLRSALVSVCDSCWVPFAETWVVLDTVLSRVRDTSCERDGAGSGAVNSVVEGDLRRSAEFSDLDCFFRDLR